MISSNSPRRIRPCYCARDTNLISLWFELSYPPPWLFRLSRCRRCGVPHRLLLCS